MKKCLLMFCLTLMSSLGVMCYAQSQGDKSNREKRPSFEEFMAQRTHFFIQEMKLNDADSAKFVAVYQQLMKDKGDLMRKYHVGRELWHQLRNGETLADSVYIRLVQNDAKLQAEDAQLELSYVDRFAKVLTPRQLFEYRQAEKKFRSDFMRQGKKPGKPGDKPKNK